MLRLSLGLDLATTSHLNKQMQSKYHTFKDDEYVLFQFRCRRKMDGLKLEKALVLMLPNC
jgi:hypothetical protein